MGTEFTLGFICGEWLADDHDNIYYFSGWLASGYFAIGDLRDISATLTRDDLIGTGLNLAALIPGAGRCGQELDYRHQVRFQASRDGYCHY
jgi:hypothetical protein